MLSVQDLKQTKLGLIFFQALEIIRRRVQWHDTITVLDLTDVFGITLPVCTIQI